MSLIGVEVPFKENRKKRLQMHFFTPSNKATVYWLLNKFSSRLPQRMLGEQCGECVIYVFIALKEQFKNMIDVPGKQTFYHL